MTSLVLNVETDKKCDRPVGHKFFKDEEDPRFVICVFCGLVVYKWQKVA